MEATDKVEGMEEQQGMTAPPEAEEEPTEEAATDEEGEEAAQPEEPPRPEPPKGPVYVSPEDMLRVETTNQRKLIAAQQITILQLQLQDAVKRSQDAMREQSNLQVELEQKYGVDFNTHDVRPGDGMVVPKNMAAAGLQQRMMG